MQVKKSTMSGSNNLRSGLAKSRVSSIGLLSSAYSCTQRVHLSLEGLGSASNVLLLTGVGANLLASYLSGLIIDNGLRLASSNERLLQATAGLAEGLALRSDHA